MKKLLFFVTFGVFCISACDKVFLDVEGQEAKLQGKWQQDSADTVFYNFQKQLFQYQVYEKKDSVSIAFGYYTLQADTAIYLEVLKEFDYISFEHFSDWDERPAETGQDTIAKLYKIEHLTKDKMILSSDKETLSFHKF
jgi:hypothetical protein